MMKTYLKIISLFCLLTTGNAFAQCPEEDIILSTQEQIDDFASDYPGCTELSGNLKISVAGLSN